MSNGTSKNKGKSKHPNPIQSSGQSGAPGNQFGATPTTSAVSGNTVQQQGATQTLAQQRARHALARIEGMKGSDDGHLAAHIAGFPAMILMSGFGQACAFYLSKGGTMKLAYDALESWLTSAGRPYSGATGEYKLMTAITSNDASKYRLAQAEALAYLSWLKKFAQAFLKNEDENAEEGRDHANTTQ